MTRRYPLRKTPEDVRGMNRTDLETRLIKALAEIAELDQMITDLLTEKGEGDRLTIIRRQTARDIAAAIVGMLDVQSHNGRLVVYIPEIYEITDMIRERYNLSDPLKRDTNDCLQDEDERRNGETTETQPAE